jgi:hypothetical protein
MSEEFCEYEAQARIIFNEENPRYIGPIEWHDRFAADRGVQGIGVDDPSVCCGCLVAFGSPYVLTNGMWADNGVANSRIFRSGKLLLVLSSSLRQYSRRFSRTR